MPQLAEITLGSSRGSHKETAWPDATQAHFLCERAVAQWRRHWLCMQKVPCISSYKVLMWKMLGKIGA